MTAKQPTWSVCVCVYDGCAEMRSPYQNSGKLFCVFVCVRAYSLYQNSSKLVCLNIIVYYTKFKQTTLNQSNILLSYITVQKMLISAKRPLSLQERPTEMYGYCQLVIKNVQQLHSRLTFFSTTPLALSCTLPVAICKSNSNLIVDG